MFQICSECKKVCLAEQQLRCPACGKKKLVPAYRCKECGEAVPVFAYCQNCGAHNAQLALKVQLANEEFARQYCQEKAALSALRVNSQENAGGSQQKISLSRSPEGYYYFGSFKFSADKRFCKAIEWQLIHQTEHYLLLMSRYALDCQPFNNLPNVYEETENIAKKEPVWEGCSLRSWLNGEFFEMAFSPQEQAVICLMQQTCGGNAKWNIEEQDPVLDRVSFLNYHDALLCLRPQDFCCRPTPYARSRGALAVTVKGQSWSGSVSWWLCNAGSRLRYSMAVNPSGSVTNTINHAAANMAVRPIIMVSTTGPAPLSIEDPNFYRLSEIEESDDFLEIDEPMSSEAEELSSKDEDQAKFELLLNSDPDSEEALELARELKLFEDESSAMESPFCLAESEAELRSEKRKSSKAKGSKAKGSKAKGKDKAEGSNKTEGKGDNQKEIISLGHYPAGCEQPLQWIVLEVLPGRALVLAKEAIDCRPYHEAGGAVSWSSCSLRQWLNEVFYQEAFTAQERQGIMLQHNTNLSHPIWRTSGGEATEDYVFLLDIDQFNTFLLNTNYEAAWPTENALRRGATVFEKATADWQGACNWWLRSPGSRDYYASAVYAEGEVDSEPVTSGRLAVRPCMVIAYPEP